VAEAERIVTMVRESSIAQSIYRGRSIELTFTPGVNDRFGNIDHFGKVKVDFRRTPKVTRDEIVLDPRAPGTGKSFTCRYIASLLPETAVVYRAGEALHHVSSVFNLARMLKPALIVMEDVDLAFSSRDINVHGVALGDLFDQVDSLADDEPISMILTTNAIERVEAAVKDRPGRVSQCVFFGPPSAELRQRYVLSFLRSHDASQLDLDQIVRETDGSTQVFLKELVHRALQFAVEADRTEGHRVKPTTHDFIRALQEIRTFDGRAVRNVTGFRVETD
jgi:cell division protease FtsH